MGGQSQVAFSTPTQTFNMPPTPPTQVPIMTLQSTKWHYNSDDIKSILITTGLFALGAFVSGLSTNLNVLQLSTVQTVILSLALGALGKGIQKLLDGPKV